MSYIDDSTRAKSIKTIDISKQKEDKNLTQTKVAKQKQMIKVLVYDNIAIHTN